MTDKQYCQLAGKMLGLELTIEQHRGQTTATHKMIADAISEQLAKRLEEFMPELETLIESLKDLGARIAVAENQTVTGSGRILRNFTGR
jgi:phosphoserine phosphatase